MSTATRSGPTASERPARSTSMRAGAAALTLGALGVVFGDIGTSPLYALQTVFTADHHIVRTTQTDVYGVISLVFWAITLIVSVKYVTFIMRADNRGEGGIMALIALVQTVRLRRAFVKTALITLGVFGASLFYGDGMITPAISVLSAVEGVKVVAPGLGSLVVPITLAIVVVLFGIQRFGTGAVGRLFGPVMALWFGLLAVVGAREVVGHPEILKALSPTYGIAFFTAHATIAFISLASIVLAVTGAEALYADMGHFGRPPIRRAWFLAVFPALTLNYLGQGSLILRTPAAIDNPFFLLIPHWGRVPMVLLATVATVIASQAVISGAFSVTRQAMQLGFLPRLTVHHTSREEGQIYVPAVNWGLLAAVVGLVVGFGSSARLAAAYGIAVTGTLVIDSILFFVVVRALWRKPWWMVGVGLVGFLTVDLAFLSANVRKIVHGGWFPLTIAVAVFTVLVTWQRGRRIVTARRMDEEGPLADFLAALGARKPGVVRVPGTAIFLTPDPQSTPLALRTNVEYNHALHEQVVILSVETHQIPYASEDEQLEVAELGDGDATIRQLTACFGFRERPDVPRALRRAVENGVELGFDPAAASYFVSRISITRTDAPGMRAWRKRLFTTIAHNTGDPIAYYALPEDRTVIMGSRVNL